MTNKLNSIDIALLTKVTGGAGWGTGDGKQGYTFPSMPMSPNSSAGISGGSSPNYMRCTPDAGNAAKLDCTDKSGGGWSMPASSGTPTGE